MSLRVAFKNKARIREDQDELVDALMHRFIANFEARRLKKLKSKSHASKSQLSRNSQGNNQDQLA